MLNNLLIDFGGMFKNLWDSSGLANGSWSNYVMILISFVLMYLAIVKKFEPLLLLPIAFGMLLVNIPGPIGDSVYHSEIFINETGHIDWAALGDGGGLIDYLYLGVRTFCAAVLTAYSSRSTE